jgi:hypothetical protein
MNRRMLRYLAYIGAFLLLACDGTTAPAPGGSAPITTIKGSVELDDDDFEDLPTMPGAVASCQHFAYDSTAADIGPRGGRLQVGPQKFDIPAGALDQVVRISMVIPGDNSASVRFRPEGLRFNADAPPTLSLNYAGCKPGKGVVPTIVYVDEALNILEWMPSWRSGNSSRVSTSVAHFSRYAVAW